MSENKWKARVSALLNEALDDDSVVDLFGAFAEEMDLINEDKYDHCGGMKRYKKAMTTLARHGKEEAKFKQWSFLMMLRSVLADTASRISDWRVYRDETDGEHKERTARQEVERAERDLKYKKMQLSQLNPDGPSQ